MTGCNRWDEGVDVVVEGDAVRVTDDAMLERLVEAWTSKWDGRWRYEVRDGAFITNPERRSCSGLRPPRSSRSVKAPSARPVTAFDSRQRVRDGVQPHAGSQGVAGGAGGRRGDAD
jgi:hypothetical protein